MSGGDVFLNLLLWFVTFVISGGIGYFLFNPIGYWSIAVCVIVFFLLLYFFAGIRGWSYKDVYNRPVYYRDHFLDIFLVVIAIVFPILIGTILSGFNIWLGAIAAILIFLFLMWKFAEWREWSFPI